MRRVATVLTLLAALTNAELAGAAAATAGAAPPAASGTVRPASTPALVTPSTRVRPASATATDSAFVPDSAAFAAALAIASHSRTPSLDSRHFDIATDDAPSLGDANAPVTLVEFADFECPYCASSVAWVDSIAAEWPHAVRIVFMNFPEEAHAHAELAAEAGCAAQAQGAFWKFHHRMYAWKAPLDRDVLLVLGGDVGLDVPALAAALLTHRYRERVERDLAEGHRVGVDGTPTFFLNGRQYLGNHVRTMHAIRPLIEAAIAAAAPAVPGAQAH